MKTAISEIDELNPNTDIVSGPGETEIDALSKDKSLVDVLENNESRNVVMLFDNSYSWYRAKEIAYSITVEIIKL